MEKKLIISIIIGVVTCIIFYIFNIFYFKNLIQKIFCCCCSNNKYNNNNKVIYNELNENGKLNEYLIKKMGLLILHHPYGKGGIQGMKNKCFYVMNKNNYNNNQNFQNFSYYFNNENNFNNNNLFNNIYEYKGNNEIKEISQEYVIMPSDIVDKKQIYM
jgi:hypothetical protein